MRLRAATRGSALARWQTEHVAEKLTAAVPDVEVELVVVETAGDRDRDHQIWELGGRGVFVKEVQAAVLDGAADIAVHSAKDLPSGPAPGLVIAAVPERGDPRDALVGMALDDIPVGGIVATGSVRRRAQLAATRPDLTFAGLRGNIDTRLKKAARFHAIVVAAVALERLGHGARAAQLLDSGVMLPQVAQGALAVECRADDTATQGLVSRIEHRDSRVAVDAERSFLATLGGGCDLPVGCLATVRAEGGLVVEGLLATIDGTMLMRERVEGRIERDDLESPARLGRAVAERLLAHGGAWLLAEHGLAREPA